MKVLVIGGGVIGMAIALRLADRGADAEVIDRGLPGAEASSAAAGILAPQAESSGPGPFLELCLDSRARYPAFVAELEQRSGLEVGYQACGVLHAAFDEAQAGRLDQTVAWQQKRGLRAELLTRAQALGCEPGLNPAVLGAAHFPDDHQIDNRLLVQALRTAAERAGVRFRRGAVRALISEGDRAVGVEVEGEALEAEAVVLAAGAWSSLIPGAQLAPATLTPIRGQMLQVQTQARALRHILFSERGYLVPRADGRILAGSTMERVGFDKQVTAEGLAEIRAMALALYPALEPLPVQASWSGLRPFRGGERPLLGRGPLQRLCLATGHHRNGILLTPTTALAIAALVLGEPSEVDLTPFAWDSAA